MTIKLIDAAEYYAGKNHQDKAWEYLQAKTDKRVLAEFAHIYRSDPATQNSNQLSKNFTLGELIKSETATRRGIDNVPKNQTHLDNLRRTAVHILQPVRDHFGKPVIVSSGYRSPELNRAIGGSTTSQHSVGEAADFEIPGVSNLEVAKWIIYNLDFDQIILEYYNGRDPNSGWVHCSYTVRRANRRQSLSYNGGKYLVWRP